MSYIILNKAALERRAGQKEDPRHRYYVALLSASSFDDYVAAIEGSTPVFPPTFGAGRVAISPLTEYRYARDDRRWIQETRPQPTAPQTLNDLHDAFAQEFEAASRRSRVERLRRLATAAKQPRRVTVTTSVFERNPDVVLEVLARAGGRCEGCGAAAPFRRKSDGSPYLEVHHVVHLAAGGDDTVDNATALCPNCHRHRHFGSL